MVDLQLQTFRMADTFLSSVEVRSGKPLDYRDAFFIHADPWTLFFINVGWGPVLIIIWLERDNQDLSEIKELA